MNAVVRLNLIVAAVFLAATVIVLWAMLAQAEKDINREVLTNVSFTHRLLESAVNDEALLNKLLSEDIRHVHLEILEAEEKISQGPGSDLPLERESEVPEWFFKLIPGIDHLEEKQHFRYLNDGRVLQLRADSGDEMEEVWESIEAIVWLFLLSGLLSNIAIYFGVRAGIKPVADFLAALKEIKEGHLDARLKKYSIREINDLSIHFNEMAEALEAAKEKNQNLTHELMNVREKERAHLARELHDDLGQYLTGITAQAYLIGSVQDNPEVIQQVSKQITKHCESMQSGFKQLVRDLYPVILEQLGLLEAIRTQVADWLNIHNQFTAQLILPDEIPDLGEEYNTHIYRIVQESLNNIAQHSDASIVMMELKTDETELSLNISDNGTRINVANKSGVGLHSMQERAYSMDGELMFTQDEASGFAITLRMPLSKKEVS